MTKPEAEALLALGDAATAMRRTCIDRAEALLAGYSTTRRPPARLARPAKRWIKLSAIPDRWARLVVARISAAIRDGDATVEQVAGFGIGAELARAFARIEAQP
jgi:hypothetical protein